MKKTLIFLCFCFLFIEFSQGQITFQKAYQLNGNDYGGSVTQTFDGGYIVTGAEYQDLYVLKTSETGDTLWSKTLLWGQYGWGSSVLQSSDSGFIIAGTLSPNACLIKLNSIGNLMWIKTYGYAGATAKSVCQTYDGGYVFCGYASNIFTGLTDVYLVKTNANGDTLWTKSYGNSNLSFIGNAMQQTLDSGYVICGYTTYPGNHKICIIKTDLYGDTLWTKLCSGPDDIEANAIEQTADGGYILTGHAYDSLFGGQISLIKTDANGNISWAKNYGQNFNDIGYSVHQTSDHGFIVAGTKGENEQFITDMYLIKTDTSGNIVWSKVLGDTTFAMNHDLCFSMAICNDNGYILTGNTTSFPPFNSGIYLVKTDSLGNIGCYVYNTAITAATTVLQEISSGIVTSIPLTNINSPIVNAVSGIDVLPICLSTGIKEFSSEPRNILISPNPFSDKLTITTTNTSLSEIILYDIASRKLLQQKFTGTVTLNTEQLAKGIYIYEVRSKEEVKKGKVVKE